MTYQALLSHIPALKITSNFSAPLLKILPARLLAMYVWNRIPFIRSALNVLSFCKQLKPIISIIRPSILKGESSP